VHFALAVIPAGQTVESGVLLDAAGREIGEGQTDDCTCDAPQPALRTVLSSGRYRLGTRGAGSSTCIGLGVGRRAGDCQQFESGDGEVTALSSCAGRETIVYGLTQHRARRIEIELASGQRVAARLANLPRGRAYLLVLPGSVAVTGVRFVGVRNSAHHDTVLTPLVPADRQCGYTFEDFL
jgi:hypothetical protein